MNKKDNKVIIITAIAVIGCVAIVAIVARYFLNVRTPDMPVSPQKSVDITALKSSDGQPLLFPQEEKVIPPRPENPSALAEDDPLHWYDMEYAGWNVEKAPMPKSPGDGPGGKYVIFLKMVDHPYNTAYSNGLKQVADAYGIKVKTMVANSNVNIQGQQADQAIRERPDMVIINPVEAQACLRLLKKMNEAGLPVIASNLLVSDDSMKYCLSWTGPDDWGQMRKLAHEFARRMNYQGGYCIIRHRPGSSPYFARTWAAVTELKKIAPKMKLLAKQTTDLEAEKSMQVVSDWITRFGPELKGIFSADDSGAQTGINQAVQNANRQDIIRVAAGNSKVGMDFIKQGQLHAVTYQTAEGVGALAMLLAAEWFSGRDIPAVRYLPIRIITKDNVDDYYPPQW